jgi:hypothetical protein
MSSTCLHPFMQDALWDRFYNFGPLPFIVYDSLILLLSWSGHGILCLERIFNRFNTAQRLTRFSG